ncbi:hypothetical protein [Peribacillus deserti]|uniref:Uncharacterized protein n=1 Tax=Peribacillus deserti TaxID=673318 RepID=A0A2N5M8V3_9BACI|nr:hypothetical protein [Peribacillus deserti]PLT30772.1 hypothetical protein CUU66_06365 [Peribacillus deserti]
MDKQNFALLYKKQNEPAELNDAKRLNRQPHNNILEEGGQKCKGLRCRARDTGDGHQISDEEIPARLEKLDARMVSELMKNYWN